MAGGEAVNIRWKETARAGQGRVEGMIDRKRKRTKHPGGDVTRMKMDREGDRGEEMIRNGRMKVEVTEKTKEYLRLFL